MNHDTPFSKSKQHTFLPLLAQCPAVIPCERSQQTKTSTKPDARVVCNKAGAVFGNCRPWNLQQVLVLTVTSEGEGVHLFFGARSFLRSMLYRTQPFSCYMFLVVRGFFDDLFNSQPSKCLPGWLQVTVSWKHLFQRNKSENGGSRLIACFHGDKSPALGVAIFQHRRCFFRFTPRKGHVFVATCGCFGMLSMSTTEEGFT